MTTAATPINTPGDTLGAALDTSNFIRPAAVSLTFPTVPTWRTGKVEPLAAGAVVPALNDPGFILTAGYIHATPCPSDPSYVPAGQPFPAFAWLSDELAPYPNGDAIGCCGFNPFSVADNILTITAEPTPACALPFLPAGFSQEFLSGALSSYPYSQQYGYFEAKIKVPAGKGLWPAWWLMPTNMASPPECDIMEILGQNTSQLYTTVHDASFKTATSPSTQLVYCTDTVDLSQAFHFYGVDIGPNSVRYYLDRVLVFSEPTPADWNTPFYFILNLAVGGPTSWPGAPDTTTVFPAKMEIAEVNVWQRTEYVTAA